MNMIIGQYWYSQNIGRFICLLLQKTFSSDTMNHNDSKNLQWFYQKNNIMEEVSKNKTLPYHNVF